VDKKLTVKTNMRGAVAAVGRALVAVGELGGRGFVIKTRSGPLVITAAHCLPALPVPHPWAENSRVWRVLGLIGQMPKVIAECCFVDPVADIAVLGPPSDEELIGAYSEVIRAVKALSVGVLPRKAQDQLSGWLLSVDCTPFRCAVSYQTNGPIWRDATQKIIGGMSGSPVLANDGTAIGVVSCSGGIDEKEGGPNSSARLAPTGLAAA
jgi:hypothetical protein